MEEQHQDFHELIDELTAPVTIPDWQAPSEQQAKDPDAALPPLSRWVKDRVFKAVQKDVVKLHPSVALQQAAKLKQKRGKAGTDNPAPPDEITCSGGWTEMLHTQSDLTLALCRYLWRTGIQLPRNIEVSEALTQSPTIDDWMRVLDDFASHKLKTSSSRADHQLFDRIRGAARKLGYGITEQGLRKQASPVDRVLAFSNSKPQAVAKILATEYAALQERLRVVVVTDFERMSATSIRAVKDVLDEESGGAVACMKTLLADPISEYLNPCLVTGSLLLTDNRITDRFVAAAEEYLASEGHKMKLHVQQDEGCPYAQISANSSSWESKLYVGMGLQYSNEV